MHSTMVWKGEMAFEWELNGHVFMADADEKVGGKDKGPRPKGLVLSGLAGCTAMDVVAILNKKGIKPDQFEVTARAKVRKDHPKIFTVVTVTYDFKLKDANEKSIKAIKRAVDLSENDFCGVMAMLRANCPVETEIIVNGEKIKKEEF